jgi:[acyl-carrier-protein] S-malonyltransferase
VLGLDRDAVQAVVVALARPTDLVVANDNAPGQVVISGRIAALDEVEAPLKEAGARRVVRLPVSGPFHSPLMAGVADELATAFADEAWRDAEVPVMSNVSAEPLTDATRIRALLAEQVRSPVEWVRCVRSMVETGVDTMIECGAGAALVGMVRRIAPDVTTATVTDAVTLDSATDLLGQRVTA